MRLPSAPVITLATTVLASCGSTPDSGIKTPDLISRISGLDPETKISDLEKATPDELKKICPNCILLEFREDDPIPSFVKKAVNCVLNARTGTHVRQTSIPENLENGRGIVVSDEENHFVAETGPRTWVQKIGTDPSTKKTPTTEPYFRITTKCGSGEGFQEGGIGKKMDGKVDQGKKKDSSEWVENYSKELQVRYREAVFAFVEACEANKESMIQLTGYSFNLDTGERMPDKFPNPAYCRGNRSE